ncbi:UNVERIFIED_ORG: hypothetical protein J2Y81_002085 [Paraburkholderia sediminicola]|nr:hypothetical protein [Paraburkholderia sediminicola]
MALGDSLSDEQRAAYIRSRLVPGAVIYRHCSFTKPPKVKFLVVLAVRSDVAFFVINTDIHEFIQSRQHLLDCQVTIDQANHTFLDYDSYIDCTEAFYADTALVIDELMNDVDGYKGTVSDNVRTAILTAIDEAMTIADGEKLPLRAGLINN